MKINHKIFDKCHIWKLVSVWPYFPRVRFPPCPSTPRAFVSSQNLCFSRDICCFSNTYSPTCSCSPLSQDSHLHSNQLRCPDWGDADSAQRKEKENGFFSRLSFLSFKNHHFTNQNILTEKPHDKAAFPQGLGCHTQSISTVVVVCCGFGKG